MDVFAFVRVAEMSAAHKAFWLPLSQQSDTASDLGLIRCPQQKDTACGEIVGTSLLMISKPF